MVRVRTLAATLMLSVMAGTGVNVRTAEREARPGRRLALNVAAHRLDVYEQGERRGVMQWR